MSSEESEFAEGTTELTENSGGNVQCCDNPDFKSQTVCGLCEKTICGNCRSLVNNSPVCDNCKDAILVELHKEKAGILSMPLAIAGGIIGALVAGAIWSAIAIASNMEIGYLAIGVGWLAGMCVHLGSGRKKGQQLQILSVSCALLGLISAKYFIFANLLIEFTKKKGIEVSYLSIEVMKAFVQNIHHLVSGFDILWIFLALGAAWKISAPTEVNLDD